MIDFWCFNTTFNNVSAISWREQVNYQWNDDEVCFVLDQHAELDLYSASSLKHNPRVDMSNYSDTLFWFRPNQFLLFLFNAACFAKKQPIPIFLSLVWHELEPTIYRTRDEQANPLVWPDLCSNPRSTALETSRLTVMPSMWFWMI
jgi:hypothetical protein